jgi:integrase
MRGDHLEAGELLRRGFRPALKAAGLRPVKFHDLRHGDASALLASGVDVVRVSRTLGHSSRIMTMRIYSHALVGPGQHFGDKTDEIFGSGSKMVASRA